MWLFPRPSCGSLRVLDLEYIAISLRCNTERTLSDQLVSRAAWQFLSFPCFVSKWYCYSNSLFLFQDEVKKRCLNYLGKALFAISFSLTTLQFWFTLNHRLFLDLFFVAIADLARGMVVNKSWLLESRWMCKTLDVQIQDKSSAKNKTNKTKRPPRAKRG